MTYSGSGDVTANVQEVTDNQFPPGPTPSSSTAGCEAADFAGFVPGNIALIQRGTCTFHDKATNAQAAGASRGADLQRGSAGPHRRARRHARQHRTSRSRCSGTSFAFGEEIHNLLASGPVDDARHDLDTISETRETYNVLADTKGGDPNRVVVQGSHLDSVIAGPGHQRQRLRLGVQPRVARSSSRSSTCKPRNKVRFALWGAEELNLLGSTFYVNSLSDAEFSEDRAEPQPRHARLAELRALRVRRRRLGHAGRGPPGSAQIEQVFLNYFASRGLATSRRRSTGARTTARSSPAALRPAACSPAPR